MWRGEGVAGVARGGLRVIRNLLVHLRTFDLWEIALPQPGVTVSSHPPTGARVVVVGGPHDEGSESIVAELRRTDPWSARRLAVGALAVCVVVGDDLAHVTWLVVNETERRVCEPIPYPVAFAELQACIPWVFTASAFRGRGAGSFGFEAALHHLAARGFISARLVVDVTNGTMQRLVARHHPRRVARFTALRLLGRELTWARRVTGPAKA